MTMAILSFGILVIGVICWQTTTAENGYNPLEERMREFENEIIQTKKQLTTNEYRLTNRNKKPETGTQS